MMFTGIVVCSKKTPMSGKACDGRAHRGIEFEDGREFGNCKKASIFFDAAAIFRSPPAFFIVVRPVMSMLRPELFIP